ncbi:hypothetical protein BEP19_10325 [Ammoniphilus oxalaticus]|uniref:Thioredoxin-like fold domain-containing protein n=1 Tax=Ammoniphilus oxalaticus TaxID=66863 RepID=A0A419SFT9_9BACL|nr:thioredoxin domain-containing protein [Ammoniphilus oxalaticus]RKD22646.1 hypothetical protein BEP19_10325 [Ammoniphilus oxalaticus]
MSKKGNKGHKQNQVKKRSQAKLMNVSLAILLILIIGVIFYKAASGPGSGTGTGLNEAVNADIFQLDQQPMLGSEQAPIQIIEFADFKCSTCQRFGKQVYPSLKKDFIDSGLVQFYFINFPVVSPNGDSGAAAMAVEAVYNQNPDEFWKYYEALFAQPEETDAWNADRLVQIAKDANVEVDYEQLKEDIEQKNTIKAVNQDITIGDQAGVDGTPTLFLNGKQVPIQISLDYNSFKQLIQKEIDENS